MAAPNLMAVTILGLRIEALLVLCWYISTMPLAALCTCTLLLLNPPTIFTWCEPRRVTHSLTTV